MSTDNEAQFHLRVELLIREFTTQMPRYQMICDNDPRILVGALSGVIAQAIGMLTPKEGIDARKNISDILGHIGEMAWAARQHNITEGIIPSGAPLPNLSPEELTTLWNLDTPTQP